MALPEADRWGMVFLADDPLAERESFTPSDLRGLPLFCSEQAWHQEIRNWAESDFDAFHLEGSFRLLGKQGLHIQVLQIGKHVWNRTCANFCTGSLGTPPKPRDHTSCELRVFAFSN